MKAATDEQIDEWKDYAEIGQLFAGDISLALIARIETDTAIKAELLAALKGLREPSEHRPASFDTSQSPGHWHNVPGIWDNDNGDLSGKPCLWCAKWEAARAVLEKAKP